ncbi:MULTISPECIES: NAD(P)H-dependent oxidoreductase [Rhodobacterales]|uniref:FMN-dependent NADH-azoreductase n=1 Tax=Roseobacter sp. N2S TaxID=2663844 RepID=UPI00285570D1|nr:MULTISPECIES: NAD(P)H-dependent oxidoreductase [Rhodobacterales]MDR6264837.1 FMN-dependent NADH-azoreductase [Roseobacter sp. N2S]
MTKTILKINASARITDSASRPLVDRAVAKLSGADTKVIERDLAAALPAVSEDWLNANWTPAESRTAEQTAALEMSDSLINELKQADTLVLGLPMYNFGVPANFKAWVDLIARNGETFAYGENGPEGLLKDKRAIVIVATGGVPIGTPVDHATPFVKTVLGFIGITDVTFIDAATLVANSDTVVPKAQAAIDALAA